MLRKNPLQPPRPFSPARPGLESPSPGTPVGISGFVSAADFDRTGILTGVDPCESRYWWIAELYERESTDPPFPRPL